MGEIDGETVMRVQSVKSSTRRVICKLLLLGVSLPFFRLSQAMDDDLIVTLDELAGEYKTSVSTEGRLIVHADGRFDWRDEYFRPRTDVGMGATASGRLVPDAGAFAVHYDSAVPKEAFPPRLYAVRTSKFIVLLSTPNGIINMINAGWRGTEDVSRYFHRLLPGATDGDTKNIDRMLLVPKQFANRIQPVPLQGKVLNVGEISVANTNISPPMKAPVWRVMHLSRLMVDLGSEQGVFEGMELYVGETWRRTAGTVKRVMADRCEMHFEWADGWPPKVGDPVSSR